MNVKLNNLRSITTTYILRAKKADLIIGMLRQEALMLRLPRIVSAIASHAIHLKLLYNVV